MDSFEFNKIAGAILGTLLLVMGLGIISDTIFHRPELDQPGYVVAIAQTEETPEVDEQPEEESIAALLANASVDKGQSVARKCAACHSFEEGGASRVGPNLWNIVNAKPGSKEGFNYSNAMIAFGENNEWTYENLNAFLANPRQYIEGTSMSFAGLRRPEERADMIAYMRSLSSNPAPLPQVDSTSNEVEEPQQGAEETSINNEQESMPNANNELNTENESNAENGEEEVMPDSENEMENNPSQSADSTEENAPSQDNSQ